VIFSQQNEEKNFLRVPSKKNTFPEKNLSQQNEPWEL
jgi:hypothetical protein